MKLFKYPDIIPRSKDWELKVNGLATEVLAADVADFLPLCINENESVEFKIKPVAGDLSQAVIRPLAKNIKSKVDNGLLIFSVDQICDLWVYIPGARRLHIFIDAPETDIPAKDKPGHIFIGEGECLEKDLLELSAGETLYIASGGVFAGQLISQSQNDITIRGGGIFKGSGKGCQPKFKRGMVIANTDNIKIQGVKIINPPSWTVHLGACNKVHIDRIRIISGPAGGTDGVDVVGCTDVLIENSFFDTHDDCVVIKSMVHPGLDELIPENDFAKDVSNVEVRQCTLLSQSGGSAMEIGYELRCDHVRNIHFHDIDVLCVNNFGSVFGIHNGDHAEISDVVWENIRVEHHYDKLIDFRILFSRWNTDAERGQVHDITLRNIEIYRSIYNQGYTSSLIGGWDEEHQVKNIFIQNLSFDGQPVTNQDELDLFTKQTENIQIIS